MMYITNTLRDRSLRSIHIDIE